MLVTALKGLKVMDVACGSGDAQTLAVTENGKNTSLFFKQKDFQQQPGSIGVDRLKETCSFSEKLKYFQLESN